MRDLTQPRTTAAPNKWIKRGVRYLRREDTHYSAGERDDDPPWVYRMSDEEREEASRLYHEWVRRRQQEPIVIPGRSTIIKVVDVEGESRKLTYKWSPSGGVVAIDTETTGVEP